MHSNSKRDHPRPRLVDTTRVDHLTPPRDRLMLKYDCSAQACSGATRLHLMKTRDPTRKSDLQQLQERTEEALSDRPSKSRWSSSCSCLPLCGNQSSTCASILGVSRSERGALSILGRFRRSWPSLGLSEGRVRDRGKLRVNVVAATASGRRGIASTPSMRPHDGLTHW